VTVPESLDGKKDRLFRVMTERLGREPLRRDMEGMPEPVVDDLLKYYAGDGKPIHLG
jgi:hypothetical protein